MQTNIILTQSFVDEISLKKIIVNCFHDTPNLVAENIKKGFCDFENNDVYDRMHAGGRIINLNFEEKKDFKKNISGLYETRNEPTILFLGSLDKYSEALQEGMLKLLEEPPINLFIFLFAGTTAGILDTIKSRSQLIALPTKTVFQIINKDLQSAVVKKLPSVKDVVMKLLQSNNSIVVENINKVEREEISFWLWQISQNLNAIFVQKPSQKIAKKLGNVLLAIKYNQDNVQKKLVVDILNT